MDAVKYPPRNVIYAAGRWFTDRDLTFDDQAQMRRRFFNHEGRESFSIDAATINQRESTAPPFGFYKFRAP